jgi:hypothetical protein
VTGPSNPAGPTTQSTFAHSPHRIYLCHSTFADNGDVVMAYTLIEAAQARWRAVTGHVGVRGRLTTPIHGS